MANLKFIMTIAWRTFKADQELFKSDLMRHARKPFAHYLRMAWANVKSGYYKPMTQAEVDFKCMKLDTAIRDAIWLPVHMSLSQACNKYRAQQAEAKLQLFEEAA